MKSSYWLLLAATALILNGCVKVTSVAGKYKASKVSGVGGESSNAESSEGGEESAEGGGEEGGEESAEGGEESAEGGGEESTGGETAPAGDAAKGATLLNTCKTCHVAGGIGKVALTKDHVEKLGNVAPGGEKADLHTTVKDSFNETNRPDLEAALNAL